MAPKRKFRNTANRSGANRSTSKASRRKATGEETNVEEWVYRFLGNLAAIERDKADTKKRNMAIKSTDRRHSLKANRLRLRSPTPYAWAAHRHSMDTDDEEEDDAIYPSMNHAISRVARTNDGPHVAHIDPTLLQKINRYIRAGIAEGKRRAKRYVLKALAFAVETGYLFPADREGKLLRVSPALLAAKSKSLFNAKGTKQPVRRNSKENTGRVQRRGNIRKKTNKVRRRRLNEASGQKSTAPDVANKNVTVSVKRKTSQLSTSENRENKTQSREKTDKLSVGLRKSSVRPSSSTSKRSYQRPIEEMAPVLMRIGSSNTEQKPLSARSRPSSFARRTRDDDLLV